MIPRLAALVVSLLSCIACANTVSAQENQGTAEQRAACAADAFRLCSSYIPDPAEVASCLRQKHAELSGPCRSVFDAAGAATAGRPNLRKLSNEY
jgi:hypothetical protein